MNRLFGNPEDCIVSIRETEMINCYQACFESQKQPVALSGATETVSTVKEKVAKKGLG